ncbi:MAG: hemin uptake protein HemP [Planctomycetia bacterium]|nr:hemin uptake protein HemP [Planctomycetia bacterium]
MVNPLSCSGGQTLEVGPQGPPRDAGPPCQLCGIEIDAKGARRTTSSALLGSKTELHILHNGEIYRLTLTRFGKLMLQK